MKTFVSLLSAAIVLTVGLTLKAEEKKTRIEKSTDLINANIKNKSGDHIGYLEDLAIERPSGRVAYAALSTKNALGLGGKLYAIPFSPLVWSDDHKNLVLDVKKNEFDNAEGFDSKSWPTQVDPRWAKLSNKPAFMLAKDARLVRLSSLTGLAARNEAGATLGKVHGFGMDWNNERIVYAAMSHGGVVGIGAKYFAIPWEALNLKSLDLRVDDRCFVLNATPQDFDNANGFDPNSWPDKGNDRFLKNAKRTTK
jgi:sporulation protein YlmC with PRC-barrel domain